MQANSPEQETNAKTRMSLNQNCIEPAHFSVTTSTGFKPGKISPPKISQV